MITTCALFFTMLTGLLPAIAAAAPEPTLILDEVIHNAFGVVLN